MNEAPTPGASEPRPPWGPWLIVDSVMVVLVLAMSHGAEGPWAAEAIFVLSLGYAGVKWWAFFRGAPAERLRLLLSAVAFTFFAVGVVAGTLLRMRGAA
jgi:hypothetical protein